MVCEGKKKKKFLTIAALTFHATKVLAGITKGLPEEICSWWEFGWQTTTLLAAGINCLTQSGKKNEHASSNEGWLPPKLSLEFCYDVSQRGF